MVQSSHSKYDLDLWTSKLIDVILRSWSTHVWSITIVCQKKMELLYGNSTKFEVPIRPWPLDPEIYRGPPWVMVNTCVKCHQIQKVMHHVETMLTSKYKFDLDLWTFNPKINTCRGLPPVMGNTCVKYHYYMYMLKGKGVIVWKPLFHRQTDGQTGRRTAKVKPEYHPQLRWQGNNDHHLKSSPNN